MLAALKSAVYEQWLALPRTADLLRVEVPLPEIDLLPWLQRQAHGIKVYWCDRERRFEMAGVGCADLQTLPSPAQLALLQPKLQANPALRYFGGFRFDAGVEADELWQPFGDGGLLLPRFELFRDSTGCYLVCHAQRQETWQVLKTELEDLDFADARREPPPNRLLEKQHWPDQAQWSRQVASLLPELEQPALQKVVLARRTSLTYAAPLSPLHLLQGLQATRPQAFHFCFQLDPDTAFIGSTPERLYRRKGPLFKTEALAGTRPRGGNEAEDRRLAQELLTSAKENFEHALVSDMLSRTLGTLCQSFTREKNLTLRQLPDLQHLCHEFHGTLQGGISDQDILAALHPTPAVAGSPREAALQAIRQQEPFDRGWYAGPIGWLSAGAAEFAVGIRSALIQGHHVHLFAGAGLVPGSEPAEEWQELETKTAKWWQVLPRS